MRGIDTADVHAAASAAADDQAFVDQPDSDLFTIGKHLPRPPRLMCTTNACERATLAPRPIVCYTGLYEPLPASTGRTLPRSGVPYRGPTDGASCHKEGARDWCAHILQYH
jgi:hypothetical protein